MAALVEFYHPYPSDQDLITIDNATPVEIEVVSSILFSLQNTRFRRQRIFSWKFSI